MGVPHDLFTHPLYYLHSHYRFESKRSSQACDFYAADGHMLLRAEVAGIPGDIPVRPADGDEPWLWLRPRPKFVVNGRYDVRDARSGEHLGILERGGRILDAQEHPVALIADPATLGDRLKEGAINALVDAALSMGEGRAAAHRANELQLHAGGRPVGLCRRTDLPFAPRTAVDLQGFSPKRWLGSVLPARAAAAIASATRPSGWRIEFTGDTDDRLDPRLRLAAVLLRIEIERRYQSA